MPRIWEFYQQELRLKHILNLKNIMDKRQKNLLILLSAAIIFSAVFLWITRKKSSQTSNYENIDTVFETSSQSLPIKRIDLDIFEKEEFKKLEKWGKYPIDIEIEKGKIGRKNPFIPYSE